jgi:uncharacterized protein YraI
MTGSRTRRVALKAIAVLASTSAFLLVSSLPAAAAAMGTVQTAGDPLTVRRAPSTSSTAVTTAANGKSVSIDCQTTGTSVTGTFGTTTLWDYVPALGGYVSDAYILTGSDGRIAEDCGIGTNSAQCSTGVCAGETLFRSAGAHFLVYDKVADGKSAVVAYWLKGGIGPLYAWDSNGEGTNTDVAVSVAKGGWVYYKSCIANFSTSPTLEACSAGLTDYAS